MLNATFWKNKSVLVTGHTGFKGSWLILWLKLLGAKVSGYSLEAGGEGQLFSELKDELMRDGGLRHRVGDIRDSARLSGWIKQCSPEVVFHLAAQPLVRDSYKIPVQTWETNVIGSLNVLEGLKDIKRDCAVVMITTDKVYENREWDFGYRENDRLGGHDPYSASKAGAELAIASWRKSFCGLNSEQNPYLRIATARAGNVIGGGDWAKDRIVPDAVRALRRSEVIQVRNPKARRPWQHVLEPLGGYLILAQALLEKQEGLCSGFNFGPTIESNKSVGELMETILSEWEGSWENREEGEKPHEAELLHLQIDKAKRRLGWRPLWGYDTTVRRTIQWYKENNLGKSALDCCYEDLAAYCDEIGLMLPELTGNEEDRV